MSSLRLSRLVLCVFGLFGLFNFTSALHAQQIASAREPQAQSAQDTLQRASLNRSPIFFVENVGQFADARIQFQAQIGSSILTVRNKSLVLSVLEPLPNPFDGVRLRTQLRAAQAERRAADATRC